MVPVNELLAVPVCGLIASESVFAVVELNSAELVVVRVEENAPDDCVNPVKPDIAPPEVTSQDVVSIATVLELLPSVVAPVEERVVNAPVPGVAPPILTKLAAPAPVIFQLSSLRVREEATVVVPTVMELATAPVPIVIVSAVVPPVPMAFHHFQFLS